jgi:hypothetical protein
MTRSGGLRLPKVWTLSAERVIEAVVIDLETRGHPMPGLRAFDYDLDRLTDGNFILRAFPREGEGSDS